MTWRRVLKGVLGPIISLVAVVAIWQAIVVWGHVAPYIAPRPLAAFQAITSNWSVLWPLTSWTIKETVYGFVAGVVLGVSFGVIMAKIPFLARTIYPVLIMSQAIPIVALALPLVLILGFSLMPKVVIVAWIVFFPVTVNVLDGLNNVDKDLLTLSRVLGASKFRTFVVIEIPGAITPLFSGLKIGATYAVTGAIIAELAASTGSSLALYQHTEAGQLNAAGVYGTTILMTAIGMSWFLLTLGAEYLCTPWRRRSVARRGWRGAKNSSAVTNKQGE
jgi:ABC-type nitrate/sulfonate/bicarbonate transport system permease component